MAKNFWMTGQGEMVNTPADDVDTIVDHQLIVLPEQGQQMREHTPWPQPLAPAPLPQTPEPRPQPCTPETHPLRGLEHCWLMTPQQPHPAVPTQRAARNTSDVNVDHQLLSESAGGDTITNVPLTDIFSTMPLALRRALVVR